MLKTEKENIFFYLTIYLINPFLSFIIAIKNFGSRESKAVILLFFIFLGATFRPTYGADGYANYERFLDFGAYSFKEIFEHTYLAFLGRGYRGFEQFQAITSFIVSQFSMKMGVIFAFWAFLFGMIYLGVVSPLIKYYREKNGSKNTLIYLIAFSLYIPIMEALNGRFWFGYWYFVLCVYKVIVDKEIRFVYLSVFAPLIHQGLLFCSILLILHHYLSKLVFKKEIYLYGLVIISYIYSYMSVALSFEFLSFMGGGFEEVGTSYMPKTTEVVVSNIPWFLQNYLTYIFYTSLFLMIFYRIKYWKIWSANSKNLYLFILLFWSFSNFISNIPSVGGRYNKIMIGLLLMLLFLVNINLNFKHLVKHSFLFASAFLYYFIVNYRIFAELTYEYIFLANPVLAFIFPPEQGLWDFLRSIFKG